MEEHSCRAGSDPSYVLPKPEGPSINFDMNNKWLNTPVRSPQLITQIPEGLVIIQTTSDLGHYVLAPAWRMTLVDYEKLLNQVVTIIPE